MYVKLQIRTTEARPREDEIERVIESALQKIELDDEMKENLLSMVLEPVKHEDEFTGKVLKSH